MRLAGRTALFVTVAGLAAAYAAIPAGVANAGGTNGGGVNPPTTTTSSGPASYAVTVQGNINIIGDVNRGQGINEVYKPPECWLQPWFKQPESWHQGDPQSSGGPQGAIDADSFWWYIAVHYPGLKQAIAHDPGARDAINGDFQMVQQGQNDVPGGPNPVTPDFIWWAPNWLNDAQGWACANALIGVSQLNNGFLDLEPPGKPNAGAPAQITDQNLAALARAALRLPQVKINTQPDGGTTGTSAYVNTPTQLWLTYTPKMQPTDTAQVRYVGGIYMWATITTSVPTVTITTSDPGAKINNNGNCLANSKCSVTFDAPTTTGNPYTITVTATWTVNWTASTGAKGTFTQPPAQRTVTHNVIVREIQSVN
jgi:hypothetical protein